MLRSAGGCSLGSTAVDRAIRESAFQAAGRPAGSLRFSLRWLIRAVPVFRKVLRHKRLRNRADGPLSSIVNGRMESHVVVFVCIFKGFGDRLPRTPPFRSANGLDSRIFNHAAAFRQVLASPMRRLIVAPESPPRLRYLTNSSP